MVTIITRKNTKNGIYTRTTIGATYLKFDYVYIYNFTLGVTWAGSHQATPLTFSV